METVAGVRKHGIGAALLIAVGLMTEAETTRLFCILSHVNRERVHQALAADEDESLSAALSRTTIGRFASAHGYVLTHFAPSIFLAGLRDEFQTATVPAHYEASKIRPGRSGPDS